MLVPETAVEETTSVQFLRVLRVPAPSLEQRDLRYKPPAAGDPSRELRRGTPQRSPRQPSGGCALPSNARSDASCPRTG